MKQISCGRKQKTNYTRKSRFSTQSRILIKQRRLKELFSSSPYSTNATNMAITNKSYNQHLTF